MRLQLPVELPQPEDVRLESSDLPLDPVVARLKEMTEEQVGNVSEDSVTTFTQKALQDLADPQGLYSIVIDPNTNTMRLLDEQGNEVRGYHVGTGDITGKRYGEKYFTPTGIGEIIQIQKRPTGPRQEGPFKMRMSLSFYKDRNPFLIHGQYEPDKVIKEKEKFINQGFISHGCVRMFNNDMLELSQFIQKGCKVEVLPYKGSEPTRKIFGRKTTGE